MPVRVPSHMVDEFLVTRDEDECMWSFELDLRIYVDHDFNTTMLEVRFYDDIKHSPLGSIQFY